MAATIDWLSYTVRKSVSTVDEILEILPHVLPDDLASEMFPIDLDDFSTSTMEYEMRNGRFRYNHCMRFLNGVDVLWEPSFSCSDAIRSQMGFHVVLSGSVLKSMKSVFDEVACAVWIDKMNSYCTVELDDGEVVESHKYSWKVARCDIAYDSFCKDDNDISSFITMNDIKQKLEAGEYSTRATVTCMTKIVGYQQRLETVYIGNRKSERFMRIYDKKIEQGLTDEECKNWVRLEMEFHDQSCIDALDCFCNGTVGGLFLGFFRFLENLNDSNRCRNEVWKKMAEIFEFKDVVRVSRARSTSSDAFLKKVCIPMLLAYYQENPTLVANEINRAIASPSVVARLKREKQEIQQYLRKGSIDPRYYSLENRDELFLNKAADSLWHSYDQLELQEA